MALFDCIHMSSRDNTAECHKNIFLVGQIVNWPNHLKKPQNKTNCLKMFCSTKFISVIFTSRNCEQKKFHLECINFFGYMEGWSPMSVSTAFHHIGLKRVHGRLIYTLSTHAFVKVSTLVCIYVYKKCYE